MNDSKIALITGATSGIGKNTAEAFIDAGYRVVVTGRRKELLDNIVANCDADNALACAADVTDPEEVDKLYKPVSYTHLTLPTTPYV